MSNSAYDNFQRQMDAVGNDYTLFRAGDDQLATAFAAVLENKLGIPPSMGTEIALLLQSQLGLGNQGVAAARSSMGSAMTWGIPALDSAGRYGVVSGQDIATNLATRAVQTAVRDAYTDPRSGMVTSRAMGLNSAEVAYAGAQALASGGQYNGGPLLQERLVTEEFKQERIKAAEASGRKSAIADAKALVVEAENPLSTFTITENGKERLLKITDDMVATLSTIKDVLGSDAMRDLDGVTRALLGGSLSEFGGRQARLRLTQIQSLAAHSFGGDTRAAAAFSQANAQGVAMGIGGGQMSPAEAYARFGMAGNIGAQLIDAAAIATVRSDKSAGGLYQDAYGRPLFRTRDVEEAAQTQAVDAGTLTREETELASLGYLLKTGGTADDKKEFEALKRELVEAGGDPKKVAAVRRKAAAAVRRVSGGSSVASVIETAGGLDRVLGETAADFQTTAVQANQARYNDLVGENMRRNKMFGTKALGGLTEDEGVAFGLGAVNLNTADRAALKEALGDSEKVDKLLEQDTVKKALETAGIDVEAFRRVAATKANDQTFQTALMTAGSVKGFVSAGELAEQMGLMDKTTLLKLQGGNTPRGDILTEFLTGLAGTRNFTDEEMIGMAAPKDVKSLALEDGNIVANEKNLKVLQGLMGDKAPKDVEALRAMLVKKGGFTELTQQLGLKNIMVAGNDALRLVDREKVAGLGQKELLENAESQIEALTGRRATLNTVEGETMDETRDRIVKILNTRLGQTGKSGHSVVSELAYDAFRGGKEGKGSLEKQLQLLGLVNTGALDAFTSEELLGDMPGIRKALEKQRGEMGESIEKRRRDGAPTEQQEKGLSNLNKRIAAMREIEKALRLKTGAGGGSSVINVSNASINVQNRTEDSRSASP